MFFKLYLSFHTRPERHSAAVNSIKLFKFGIDKGCAILYNKKKTDRGAVKISNLTEASAPNVCQGKGDAAEAPS